MRVSHLTEQPSELPVFGDIKRLVSGLVSVGSSDIPAFPLFSDAGIILNLGAMGSALESAGNQFHPIQEKDVFFIIKRGSAFG